MNCISEIFLYSNFEEISRYFLSLWLSSEYIYTDDWLNGRFNGWVSLYAFGTQEIDVVCCMSCIKGAKCYFLLYQGMKLQAFGQCRNNCLKQNQHAFLVHIHF